MIPFEILAIKLPDESITEAQRLLAVAEIEQEIKNYCNIDAVPEALHFTWANMAADLLRYEQAANQPSSNTTQDSATQAVAVAVGQVASITEGDTSISFSTSQTEAQADRERLLEGHRQMLDALILDYKQQLQQFRRVVFQHEHSAGCP